MTKSFELDYYRMTGKVWSKKSVLRLLMKYDIKYLYFLRRYQKKHNGLLNIFIKLEKEYWRRKYGLEIHTRDIGDGLYLGHAHNISVNENVTIGKNCNLNKGCTLGAENRGKRRGAPSLGDCVWVGTNAVIVGKVTIGDDVLIAPNAFVNCDVPSHSIVVGNPCRIVASEVATRNYIENQVK